MSAASSKDAQRDRRFSPSITHNSKSESGRPRSGDLRKARFVGGAVKEGGMTLTLVSLMAKVRHTCAGGLSRGRSWREVARQEARATAIDATCQPAPQPGGCRETAFDAGSVSSRPKKRGIDALLSNAAGGSTLS